MYSNGGIAEYWFRENARKLGLLDVEPPLSEVKRVLNRHLKAKVRTAIRYMSDETDPQQWLDLVLKTDCLLLVENIEGQVLRVAVDVTIDQEKAEEKLEEVRLPSFRAARRELQIARHWIVVVKALEIASPNNLVDIIYDHIDRESECAVVWIK